MGECGVEPHKLCHHPRPSIFPQGPCEILMSFLTMGGHPIFQRFAVEVPTNRPNASRNDSPRNRASPAPLRALSFLCPIGRPGLNQPLAFAYLCDHVPTLTIDNILLRTCHMSERHLFNEGLYLRIFMSLLTESFPGKQSD